MMETCDALIIGAGACGLMCAVQAGFLGKKVIVLEKNVQAGAKILISGGGRCNYTNLYSTSSAFISENEHFCKSSLSQWSVDDTISFFEAYGIYGQEKTLGQLFPQSNKARDIVDIFVRLCGDLEQVIHCDTEVTKIEKQENSFVVTAMRNGKMFQATSHSLVIATGGLPIQKMGATDFALRTAKQFGIKLTQTAPALVPLTITGKDAEWYAALSGNTVFCRVWNDRISFEENILFTHWGLSGPAILQISSYWRPGEWVFIDLLPGSDITSLLTRERESNGKRTLMNFIAVLFSRKIAEALEKFVPVEKNLASLTKAELEEIHSLIHNFSVKPAGDKGYDKAEVMRGGISTEELSSKSLEAKKIPGLFFGGECVDVTGWLGGYNFQWAWASGFVIAQNV